MKESLPTGIAAPRISINLCIPFYFYSSLHITSIPPSGIKGISTYIDANPRLMKAKNAKINSPTK